MRVEPIKSPLVRAHDSLDDLLLSVFSPIADQLEESVVVVTSKIVALCEGRVFAAPHPEHKFDKHALARQLADAYIEPIQSKYNVMLTITDSIMAVNAGIDESNVESGLVALPADSFASAEYIWFFLRNHFSVNKLGVVITDSTSVPLKWGTIGRSLGFCGFEGLISRIGEPDLFGRTLQMTKMNIAEGIAAAAVLEMGEGAEATPFAVVSEVRHLKFRATPLSDEERAALTIELEDDVYYPVLKAFEEAARKNKQ